MNKIISANILIASKHFICFNRLHREALKQSAIDPLSGKIDISILTTGISSVARKRKKELCDVIQKLIEKKDKIHILNQQKLLAEIRQSSEMVGKQFIIDFHIMRYVKQNYYLYFSLLTETCLKMP